MATPNREALPEFTAYGMGLCYASVCTALTDEQATERLNAEQPTGIESRWRVSPASTFRRGGPNPGPCEESPGTHRHILFEC